MVPRIFKVLEPQPLLLANILQSVEPNVLQVVSRGDYEAVELSTVVQKALKLAALPTATSVGYDDGLDSSTWKQLRQQTTDTLNTMNLAQEEKSELVATLALFEQLCTLANLLALNPTRL